MENFKNKSIKVEVTRMEELEELFVSMNPYKVANSTIIRNYIYISEKVVID